MPNNTKYTRCPQCSTAFKVTPEMLTMAKGKVRCGACLQVFQADKHLLQLRPKDAIRRSEQASVRHAAMSSQGVDDNDDFIAADDYETRVEHDIEQAGDEIDELLSSPQSYQPDEQFEQDLDDVGDQLDLMDSYANEFDETAVKQDIKHAEDELDQLLDDTSPDLTAAQSARYLEDDLDDASVELDNLLTTPFQEPAAELPKDWGKRSATDDQSELPMTNTLSENLALQITDTQVDPLDEFEGRVAPSKTVLRNGVIGATAALLVLIIFINFWSSRQELAWDDTWGGFTHFLCAALPCDIQPRRDLDRIRLRQRVVTPSSEQEKMLDVKMLMVNDADFEQPYPTIVIKFSNSLGVQVAEKQFTVSDYFPEKVGQMMPAKKDKDQEILITFSTELPHPDALGFEFIFN